MPVAPTYPGVYVEELPSGVHTITGVSTAVTAFLGYFSQGPMNQATQIFSPADLERTFGSLVANSEAGYGIQQFFANGGAEAWVVRVAAAPAAGSTTPAAPESAGIVIEEAPSGTGVLQVTAASPGSWGNNVRLAVDYNTPAGTPAFNLTVTLVDSSSPPAALTTEVYRNLTLDPTSPNYAVAVVNNASALVQLALVETPAATALPAPTGTVGANVDTSSVTLASLVGPSLDVTFGDTALTAVSLATAPKSWTGVAVALQSLLQGLTTGTPPAQAIPGATVTLIQGSGTNVQLAISANAASSTFTFGGELASALGLDATGADGTVTNVMQYALGGSAAGAQATPPPPAGGSAGPATGSNGTTPNATGLIGDPVAKTGLYALDNVDVFNILCLPDVMNLDDGSAFAVISAAETYCASRWAFLLVDVPQGGVGLAERDTLTGIQDWLAQYATLRSSYAALYYPRPQIPDPLNGYRLRSVGPSGTIAGLYAQTDGTRGVWKAPAGTAATLTNVSSLAYKMTDAENGALNPLAINCLRSFPVYGNVCWGARTLDGADQLASDWKYIPVRRTALYIEASLYQGTQWVVFEPNDEPLWSQIRLNVGSFMRGLFQQGAFQGSTPASAYFVKCDSDTTTQADINLGQVNILVGFAPLKPAEFVILQIQQIAGQIPT
jgi:Bacteriophage tail sheath protein